jgi:hypothetical protein
LLDAAWVQSNGTAVEGKDPLILQADTHRPPIIPSGALSFDRTDVLIPGSPITSDWVATSTWSPAALDVDERRARVGLPEAADGA